jgi:hypothetical protein
VSTAYFTIFRQGKQARVSRLLIPAGKQVPSDFRYEGRIYRCSRIALSTGDHFLDARRELVGFSFILGGDTEVAQGRLAKECANVEIESGAWLKFYLTDDRSAENDCCQFIYPVVYSDEHSDHIVLVEECPKCWTALGFRLATQPLPEPVFEGTLTA